MLYAVASWSRLIYTSTLTHYDAITRPRDAFVELKPRLREDRSASDRERQTESVVLVLVTHPRGTPYAALEGTIRDAVSSSTSKVLAYVSAATSRQLQLKDVFAAAVHREQLILVDRAGTGATSTANGTLSDDLLNDMDLAYLLDLVAPKGVSKYNYTLILRAGARLEQNVTGDYATLSAEHYTSIQEMRKLVQDSTRTCWTKLSAVDDDDDPTSAMLLETAEHAARLATILRSVLPYNRRTAAEILRHYCERILWEARPDAGPPLFRYAPPPPPPHPALARPQSMERPFVNASEFQLPHWIDSTEPVGPRIYGATPSRWIAFGVNSMARPSAGNAYLVPFMEELLQIVDRDFKIPATNTTAERYAAIIVVLVCGNSVAEIATHRHFLESTYDKAIELDIVRLVDAPLQITESALQNMHTTYTAESHRRRYWRSKQSLDVAATLQATAGLSEYVMLLEDDSGFQPGFVESLKDTMTRDSTLGYQGDGSWSMVFYGFGYSGMLLRAADLPVYQQLHAALFDERPCDNIDIWRLIREGRRPVIVSPTRFKNKLRTYLTHRGKESTLAGKTQPVW